ncbi:MULTISPECIES: twin-arginine translocase subunit TatC [Sporosarcina]|uniref:Sec-independent protein translocase protein TatC n=2 Tax=Sporosarcina newyorkensis TaxID=759851 RepID=A0A1T4YS96_9BACL|nr:MULTISPECIES: twin-arginine translocase subunit TatC [Sporosarcina]EGQ26086.1 sec-independent protein translocase TatC [Sporosarcina newyorkensis 2681]MBY0223280.1 twin-arginine translocase subunit TatC [Sporosarcina aquimarina]SKB04600.1 sec-independent protein translocase protein TatC [Sporosarcina newyorkensis]
MPEESKRMNDPAVFGHLDELRRQLIKSAVVFTIVFIFALSTIHFWFPYIIKDYKLLILSPFDVLSFYMTISLALSIGLSIPFICHFIYQFVKPGLTKRESKFFSLYTPVIFLLFLFGLTFGYLVINPISYSFLTGLGAIHFDVMISASEYARFLLYTTVPIALMFELPIVALFLATIEVLTVATMKKTRKWSYVILALLSAVITPPDFISQLLVLIPMILLYEISIRVVARVEKRRLLKQEEEEMLVT